MTQEEAQLQDKIFKATSLERNKQTITLVSKLEEIKNSLPEAVDLTETNQLLQELIDEMSKPISATIKII